MSNFKETVLEINLAHLSHNFKYLKSKLHPEVKFLSVVKASGYGSDVVPLAKHLEKLGTDYFAVAYVSEGIVLRNAGITTPILVLHPQPVNFAACIEYRLEPNIYSKRILECFTEAAHSHNVQEYPIHIKFNTGLNRLGFIADDIAYIVQQLNTHKVLSVQSILSHLAASEDHKERDFTRQQIEVFKKITATFSATLGYTPIVHQCNTSGILNYPDAHFSMVRSGIGLYGYGNDTTYDVNLKPVATLKSVISQIHELAPGETLGYNRAFKATKKTITATIPIGHADGISRQYGMRKGFVLVHGKRAYITGNVCMDMLMIDITDIPCKEGDEVIFFDAHTGANNMAEHAGTISYELLTAIAPRVKRKVIDEI
ncbi:alanine racemase [Aquimarina hainanensis]|uniref:Alanine racemase n=1 Tax=Aquimarina hainanensis TaxID=1578017 RepID=A0ABW5N105_9FLAO